MDYLNSVTFTIDAQSVLYASSLTDWKPEQVEHINGKYVIRFQSNDTIRVHYKLILDGEWKLLDNHSQMNDRSGNVNNCIDLLPAYRCVSTILGD